MKNFVEMSAITIAVIVIMYTCPKQFGAAIAIILLLIVFGNITDGLSKAYNKYKKIK